MLNVCFLAIVAFFALLKPAYAYIDAGTGSLILQALLGGVVGFSAFIKIYWMQIKLFFSRITSGKKATENSADNTAAKEE